MASESGTVEWDRWPIGLANVFVMSQLQQMHLVCVWTSEL